MKESADIRRGMTVWTIKNAASTVVSGVLMFLAAGRLDWIMGWVYVAIMVVNVAGTLTIIGRRNPDLVAERSGLGRNTKPLDPPLAIVMAFSPLLIVLAAALDRRFGWTRPPALGVSLAMLVPVLAGWIVMYWVMMANRFFSGTVRIQSERGHTVVSTGPYRIVRHPGYAMAIVIYAALPIMLGSVCAFVPFAPFLAVVVARTALEDRTLRRELPGYEEYSRRTRYRLVPGLW
jgi:protein-S-isoprenylcysteine O-methyltransferase Ste14